MSFNSEAQFQAIQYSFIKIHGWYLFAFHVFQVQSDTDDVWKNVALIRGQLIN